MKERKKTNLVGFGVRAESGSRFGPERLGGDDCHPLARCSATVNMKYAYLLPDRHHWLTKTVICDLGPSSKSFVLGPTIGTRSGILTPNHSFTVSSNLFRDCQRFGVPLGQPDPKLSINRSSDIGYKVCPCVELNWRSSKGEYCFSLICNPVLCQQAQLVNMLCPKPTLSNFSEASM